MSEVVVDTNVWVKVDENVKEVDSDEEKQCIFACQDWLDQFVNSEDHLIIDDYTTWKIMSEYRNNVRRGGVAENILNELLKNLFHRLVMKKIRLDQDGTAVIPRPIQLTHGKDRKFVAVALQCDPYATIFYATDRGWAADKAQLQENGLNIHELCPEYIEAKRRTN